MASNSGGAQAVVRRKPCLSLDSSPASVTKKPYIICTVVNKMSIQVIQSQTTTFNAVEEQALQTVLARLEQQKDSVKSVQVLENFSIDSDTALQMDAPLITKGLVVCVEPDYKLGREDMSWFHPMVGRGRSVYLVAAAVKKSALQGVTFETHGSLVGEFTTSRPDEFGCEEVSHHVIVDTAPDLKQMYAKWLDAGVTAGELATEWKRTSFGEVKSISSHGEQHRDSLLKVKKRNTIYSDTVNDVLTDMSHIYFTNNCVKHSETILMKSSGLGGYRMYESSSAKNRFYPASLGMASAFYSWQQMNQKNIARIETACSWDDQLSFCTQVMRQPSIRNEQLRGLEDQYNLTDPTSLMMRQCHFSGSASFVDKMRPEIIFQLTPPTASKFITAPIDPSHPVFEKLVKNIVQIQAATPSFQLLNPEFVKGGRLNIPREVYKQIV